MDPASSGLYFPSWLTEHHDNIPTLEKYEGRDGEELSYRWYDSHNKDRVFILLHGSCWHGEYLHTLAERMKDLGQVIVPNIRGHYASGSVRGDCSYIGQLEDDVADLINRHALRNKKIFVVGHSSGGGLAIRLAGSRYSQWFA